VIAKDKQCLLYRTWQRGGDRPGDKGVEWKREKERGDRDREIQTGEVRRAEEQEKGKRPKERTGGSRNREGHWSLEKAWSWASQVTGFLT
jgi:hypothetical protein